jgi:hypothetical protein
MSFTFPTRNPTKISSPSDRKRISDASGIKIGVVKSDTVRGSATFLNFLPLSLS